MYNQPGPMAALLGGPMSKFLAEAMSRLLAEAMSRPLNGPTPRPSLLGPLPIPPVCGPMLRPGLLARPVFRPPSVPVQVRLPVLLPSGSARPQSFVQKQQTKVTVKTVTIVKQQNTTVSISSSYSERLK